MDRAIINFNFIETFMYILFFFFFFFGVQGIIGFLKKKIFWVGVWLGFLG